MYVQAPVLGRGTGPSAHNASEKSVLAEAKTVVVASTKMATVQAVAEMAKSLGTTMQAMTSTTHNFCPQSGLTSLALQRRTVNEIENNFCSFVLNMCQLSSDEVTVHHRSRFDI